MICYVAASKRRLRPGSTLVHLNVYDISPINGYAYWFGLGAYHSGVQVHGVEYAYGAHDRATTGIFQVEPRKCPGFAFRRSIVIGRTEKSVEEVREMMQAMAAVFRGSSYHLISRNCNHFCNDVCLRLTGRCIPNWVNRLAKIGFLCTCVLPVSIAAVKEQPMAEKDASDEKRNLRSCSTRCASAPLVAEHSDVTSITWIKALNGSTRWRRSDVQKGMSPADAPAQLTPPVKF